MSRVSPNHFAAWLPPTPQRNVRTPPTPAGHARSRRGDGGEGEAAEQEAGVDVGLGGVFHRQWNEAVSGGRMVPAVTAGATPMTGKVRSADTRMQAGRAAIRQAGGLRYGAGSPSRQFGKYSAP